MGMEMLCSAVHTRATLASYARMRTPSIHVLHVCIHILQYIRAHANVPPHSSSHVRLISTGFVIIAFMHRKGKTDEGFEFTTHY